MFIGCCPGACLLGVHVWYLESPVFIGCCPGACLVGVHVDVHLHLVMDVAVSDNREGIHDVVCMLAKLIQRLGRVGMPSKSF